MPNGQGRDNFSETNGYRALGIHVHRLRQGRGLGLRQAARAAGVDPTWLSRLEQGLYTAPDARSVMKVARGLGVDVEEFYVIAGLSDGHGLPGFAPYLRAKYQLPDEAIGQLESHFRLLADKYQKVADHADDNRDAA
ncbi:MAG: helix-turn-helix domain-containing protein [Jatrophihabitantaceae bacterium]